MARGRMLNATIAKDKQLNELSIEAEYIYLKTIPHLDRDGLINGDPALLWSDVCPRRQELMPRMQAIIDEIVASGLVVAYQHNGDTVLFFRGFSKNNTGMRYEREAASEFAPPPGYMRTRDGLMLADDNTTPDKVPTESGNCRGEVKEEVKEEEEERARDAVPEAPVTPSAPPLSPKPERVRARVTHYDARQVHGGLLPKGTGKTQIEIWKESFSWIPTAAQIRDMNEKATDLGKWRQVTADCAIKAFRSYTNVMDVYLNGWRDSAEVIPKQTVTGNLGISMASI